MISANMFLAFGVSVLIVSMLTFGIVIFRRHLKTIQALKLEINERKRVQVELSEAGERFRQFYEIVPDIFVITSLESGLCVDVNDEFVRKIGYSREDAVGRRTTDLHIWVHEIDRAQMVSELKDKGKILNFSTFFRNKDGTEWPGIMSASVVSMGGKDHILSSTKDVSDLHHSTQQAGIAKKAKSDFMANMSHELRTPLNAIIGFSNMITSEVFGSIDDKYVEYARDISDSGQHLLGVINDILDVSALEEGKLELHGENIDLLQIIDASFNRVAQRAMDGNVTLKNEIDEENFQFFGDPRRMLQIFINLLSNAIKFTPENGSVLLDGGVNTSGEAVIRITDHGCGMDAQELKKAMLKFTQIDSGLDRQHEGTGLGLPLTKGLVELHGGRFDIQSERNTGTIVTLTFSADRTLSS